MKQDYAVRTGSIRPSAVELNDRKRSSIQGQVGENSGTEVKSESVQPEPVVSDEEWQVASRAARTATWGAIFYLITTDILGPFSVPWAMSQLGYGPGFVLYTIFGILCFYSGSQLWKQFLGLDSEKYPVKSYGDLAFRIYGRWARHGVNILQSLQFFLNVTLLIVGSGQAIVQLAAGSSGTGKFCFIAAEIIFAAAGFILGQVRTLQKYSHIANIAIWMNLFVIFMTMGISSSTPPNWTAVTASYNIPKGPIYHTGGTPPGKSLTDQINGLMQAVYSYGGATLFNELMAEMRRPYDFWKGLMFAEVFIYACYIIFGMVVYRFYGQATFNPAYQGINPYSWQTVGNVFSLITGLIAAGLYGNIGIKVLYANVGREIFHFPPLEAKKGKWIWVAFVPFYWGVAWVIGAAVPQISYLGSFVGASMILQFTYTFPPILMVGFNVLKDSITEQDVFIPSTGEVRRSDGGFQRLWRGYKKKFFINLFDTIYFLGALVTAILGIYASIVGMIDSYKGTQVQAFSCCSPTGDNWPGCGTAT
ncbi:MAG: hypothetical protein FE78DRAFT_146064 [Acidomyces sp. 'richmondensis']|nr:MAG: hypothetical protein FE78DRAFT_146064 [Acidomyces sp. 'richmondensis']